MTLCQNEGKERRELTHNMTGCVPWS
jgi:hypothetical protein